MENSADKVRSFWEQRGASGLDGRLVTHRDPFQVSLEVSVIKEHIRPEDVLLDIGCGNGYSTSVYAGLCASAKGIDYSDEMIRGATAAHRAANLKFEQQNVMALKEPDEVCTRVVSTRCLINLANWAEQQKALRELHRVLKRGGLLILAEGVADGRDRLNELRVRMGLTAMPPVWHNIDFKEGELLPFLARGFKLIRDVRIGAYDVITRALYPASVQPDEPKYGTQLHALAEKMQHALGWEALKEYGRLAVWVLEKTGAWQA